MMRNAVTGEPIPPRLDPVLFQQMVLERCLNDVVFRSRCGQWMRERHCTDALEYLHACLKADKDSGVPRTFANVGEAAAFVLAQQAPDEPSQEMKERERGEVIRRYIEK